MENSSIYEEWKEKGAMRGQCNQYCRYTNFAIKLLYNISVYRYWRTARQKHISIANTTPDGLPRRARRYTLKHKELGLAKCKLCEYITAFPTLPGVRCPCCNNRLSHKIQDIRQGKDKSRIRRIKDRIIMELQKESNLDDIQEKARCNWCLTALTNTTTKISSANLIDVGRKFEDGQPAYALYCNECLADENRVRQPKSVLNPSTYDQIDIASLPTDNVTETENKNIGGKKVRLSEHLSDRA